MVTRIGHNDIIVKTHIFESEDEKKTNREKLSHFHKRNMNPWGRDINDCAIRAVSAALWMKYDAVCRMFGKKCVPGRGLSGEEGIDLKHIKHRLDGFFDRIEDASDLSWDKRPEEFKDMKFDPKIDTRPDLGLTLGEFCELYANTGRFLVAVARHIVYADLTPGRNWFMDTWNSSEMPVRAYMRVKGILSRKDPRSLLYGKQS